jgi:hypothetical protein
MYDLNLIHIHNKNGQQLSESPGFMAVNPPRRAVRSRADDFLVLSFTLSNNERFSAEDQSAWVERLTGEFYKTSGSVTSAMRALIETLNLTIMEKNLKNAKGGSATTGAVNLAAIRRHSLYVVQSGPTHAYVLTQQGLQHFYDASHSDRGLGISRSPNLRYFQADLGQGGYLFMTDDPPATWTEEQLYQGAFPNLDQLRRRLLNQAPAGFRVDLVEITPGDGQITRVQALPMEEQVNQDSPAKEDFEIEEVVTEISEPLPEGVVDVYPEETQEIPSKSSEIVEDEAIQTEQRTDVDLQPEEEPEVSTEEPETEGEPALSGEIPEASPEKEDHPLSAPVEESQQDDTPPAGAKAKASKEDLKFRLEQVREGGLSALSAFFNWWRNLGEKVSRVAQNVIQRWSPGGTGSLPKLSRGTLLFIAIAVPLIVVAVAVGVYLARGQTMQYEYYYDQAQLSVQSAMAAEDPAIKRDLWMEAISYLDQAESLRETDEVTLLRDQAEDALDTLDGAVRLVYRPAIVGALYSEINITRIISYGPDLYLLDETGGRVIHALRGSQGYEIDAEFRCEMGDYSDGSINALVDMVSLPINNPYQAHVMAIDALGNVIFCGPGQEPNVQALPKPGNLSGEITRITYDSIYLYALNPSAGNILVYRPTNGQFVESPTLYFEGEDLADMPDLSQIVDLAVNGADLYLLRKDGLLVDCVSSGFAENPVTCQNPVEFVDGRPGQEDQPVNMPESDFRSVLYTTPPDPSISILDAGNADIYRFSLRFRLYQRLRSELGDYEIESPTATAFTIGIDRFAFIAFGNQVFYAYIE